ncbi:hypothetical protein FACS189472_14580 [Alphaproteobacteria bacterium]|nr:hypothetical protein FACS189472_14580 [Alphaproteobacteria bacterium]
MLDRPRTGVDDEREKKEDESEKEEEEDAGDADGVKHEVEQADSHAGESKNSPLSKRRMVWG